MRNTPNASLTLLETGRNGQDLKFHLRTRGLPKDKTYVLMSWPVTQKAPTELFKELTLNANGLVICGSLANVGIM